MRAKTVRKLRKIYRDLKWDLPPVNYEPGSMWVSGNYVFRKMKKNYTRMQGVNL